MESRRFYCASKPAQGLCAQLTDGLTLRGAGCILLGAAICTFGIHNIHQRTGITEGGVTA